ncbi:MAG: kinase [Candidatus Synechococcus spongiarum SP3]|uniref:Kinase n=1 Tax=Candidatus Synechococcus spongiarum SP3 TaxID=1604020 RepID=A0A0G2HLH2_9SYNE|nr:MAG: kinase [Candidatus Synechococcus spongiarum SP3]
MVRIWTFVVVLLLRLWWDQQPWVDRGPNREERRRRRQRRRAEWLLRELISMGPTFIKLGQLLSARPDVLPPDYVAQLSQLQDRVPPFPFFLAQQLLRKELGTRLNQVVFIEETPLGSASLAQVHEARLADGRTVVLKLQRPNLDRLFRLDLEVMQQVARLLQRHPRWGRGRDWPALALQCRRVLLRELDFGLEAEYAARFRQQFADDPMVRVPAVVWDLCSRRVLCLDHVPGLKITDRQGLLERGLNPREVASRGLGSYLRQLVVFGFFHADPHPGNLAVAEDGGLIYYDFGMMGTVSPLLRSRIRRMVTYAASRDAAGLTEELQRVGLLAKGIDLGPVRRLVRLMLKEVLTPPFSSRVLEKLSGDIYDLVYGQPFRLPPDLIFVLRALSTFEGVGRTLDPDFTLVDIAKPYLVPLMNSQDKDSGKGTGGSVFLSGLSRQAAEVGSRALGIPRRLDESLARLEQGDLQVQVRSGDSERILRRLVLAQQSSGQAMLLGALAIAAAILSTSLSASPWLALLPLVAMAPVTKGWLHVSLRLRREERLPGG